MAGALLKEMREERGLSREAMPLAMLRAGVPRERIPSIKTIYNVEEHGCIPGPRLKFAFATFFGFKLKDVWPVQTRAMA